MGYSDPLSVFFRGGTLLPSSHADARYIDDVIDSQANVDAQATRMYATDPAASGRNPPLATKNLLEDTDGLRRPPPSKGGATQSISDLSMR